VQHRYDNANQHASETNATPSLDHSNMRTVGSDIPLIKVGCNEHKLLWALPRKLAHHALALECCYLETTLTPVT